MIERRWPPGEIAEDEEQDCHCVMEAHIMIGVGLVGRDRQYLS